MPKKKSATFKRPPPSSTPTPIIIELASGNVDVNPALTLSGRLFFFGALQPERRLLQIRTRTISIAAVSDWGGVGKAGGEVLQLQLQLHLPGSLASSSEVRTISPVELALS